MDRLSLVEQGFLPHNLPNRGQSLSPDPKIG